SRAYRWAITRWSSQLPVRIATRATFRFNPSHESDHHPGQSFSPTGVAPTVYLASAKLTVAAFSSQTITATLPPAVAPGTYRLLVVNSSSQSATFDVTLATVGPMGPQGPPGVQGLPGIAMPYRCAGSTRPPRTEPRLFLVFLVQLQARQCAAYQQ